MEIEDPHSTPGTEQPPRGLLGDGIVVGAVSAIALAQAFHFDGGVCSAQGLPGWMAKAGIYEISVAATLSFAILAITNQLAPKFARRVSREVARGSGNGGRARMIVRMVICVSFTIPAAMHATYFSAATSFYTWGILLAWLFIRPHVTDARWSYWSSFFRHSIVFRVMRTPPAMPWRVTTLALGIGAFCLFSLHLARGLGWLSTLKGDAYFVSVDDPTLVLGREIGGHVVLCRSDPVSMTFSGEFVILSKDAESIRKGFRLLNRRIAPASLRW